MSMVKRGNLKRSKLAGRPAAVAENEFAAIASGGGGGVSPMHKDASNVLSLSHAPSEVGGMYNKNQTRTKL